MTPDEILKRAVAGERRFVARSISLIEQRSAQMGLALSGAAVRRRKMPGAPHVLGVTGPPGAGKSTLIDVVIERARAAGERVAIVAVDPSSPFSGGAILGDRIRMERHIDDDGVFIRSIASRGHLGGLSTATADVVDLFDACGFDRVIVETVGVGQSELSVMEVADTVAVVLTPESGDAVQVMKAGLLEIADVFVVNKADRPGADGLARELEQAVGLDAQAAGEGFWAAPVCVVSARENKGVDELVTVSAQHLAWCLGAGSAHWAKRRGDARLRLLYDLVADRAREAARLGLPDKLKVEVRQGDVSPYAALGKLNDA